MEDVAGDGVQVVIVGAGPAGLALAIELGSRSIRCLLIERNKRAGYAPRAKTTNARTREHLRRWGIAGRLAEAAPFGIDYPSHIHFVTRLGGKPIARFDHALACAPDRDERYSEHSQWIPQYKLERVMLEHARTLPSIEIAFGQELVGVEQDADEVVAQIRDLEGGEHRVRACFLVGADGARSLVRDLIEAKMVGSYGLSRNYNTIFEAPGLAEAHPHGPGIMYWQLNAEVPSMIGPMDSGDRWFFMPTGIADGAAFDAEQSLDLIRRSTGIDLPYRVLSSDEWVASSLIANRYRRGRVFLSGDACHLHPPFGGYGMNMGIADSVDLGWKIAATLEGWGGPGLLDSYESERRPAHEYVVAEAEANHALAPNQLVREAIEDDNAEGEAVRREMADLIWRTKTAEFYGLGVVLGYCLRGSSLIVDDGTQQDWAPSRAYVPSATPGCLAPHRWLTDESSLYDHFGPGFTLLILDASHGGEAEAASAEALASGTPLSVVVVDDPEVAALYGQPLALVRPDQLIAWRGPLWPSGLLDIVAGRAAPPKRRKRRTPVAASMAESDT